MAKFNKSSNTPTSVNLAGGQSFARTNKKQELISIVVNSMLKGNSFYESEEVRLKRIEENFLSNLTDPAFLLRLLVFTRNEMNLRSVTHVMALLAVENIKNDPEVRKALKMILVRPDDATEIVALWNQRHPDTMIPNSLRRAIRDRLENRWDAYQLKKYFGTGAVKVSNLIQLTHPKPPLELGKTAMFKQALEGNLDNIDTAQTVNAAGVGDQRAEAYNEMLRDGKLGLMAALKNIRNILEAELNTVNVNILEQLLTNPRAISRSRVLPFRYAQAYDVLSDLSVDQFVKKKLLSAIEKGFSLSAGNIGIVQPGERVAILLDESQSMTNFRNGIGSGDMPFYIGKTLMASMLTGLDPQNTVGMLWANNTRTVDIDKGPMQFVKETTSRGGGTNIAQALDLLITTKSFVDVIVIFTDQQAHGSVKRQLPQKLQDYRAINPNIKVVFWTLDGSAGGTQLALNDNVLEVAGYSDKILEIIPYLLNDKNALIKKIEDIKL